MLKGFKGKPNDYKFLQQKFFCFNNCLYGYNMCLEWDGSYFSTTIKCGYGELYKLIIGIIKVVYIIIFFWKISKKKEINKKKNWEIIWQIRLFVRYIFLNRLTEFRQIVITLSKLFQNIPMTYFYGIVDAAHTLSPSKVILNIIMFHKFQFRTFFFYIYNRLYFKKADFYGRI